MKDDQKLIEEYLANGGTITQCPYKTPKKVHKKGRGRSGSFVVAKAFKNLTTASHKELEICASAIMTKNADKPTKKRDSRPVGFGGKRRRVSRKQKNA